MKITSSAVTLNVVNIDTSAVGLTESDAEVVPFSGLAVPWLGHPKTWDDAAEIAGEDLNAAGTVAAVLAPGGPGPVQQIDLNLASRPGDTAFPDER